MAENRKRRNASKMPFSSFEKLLIKERDPSDHDNLYLSHTHYLSCGDWTKCQIKYLDDMFMLDSTYI